jgi:16S rRNA (guanine527-N7)-methyltransferase
MCDYHEFLRGLESLNIVLDIESIAKMLFYCEELRKWNRKMNLLSKYTPAADILEKHFLDSLLLLPLLDRHNRPGAKLLDVGSGGGFPGLVLAVARPDMEIYLLEPRVKRANFLQYLVRSLGLPQAVVWTKRMTKGEAIDDDQYTFITSRAVAEPAAFLSLVEATANPETLVLLMQAKPDPQLLASVPGWQEVDCLHTRLPFCGDPRTITAVRKRAE